MPVSAVHKRSDHICEEMIRVDGAIIVITNLGAEFGFLTAAVGHLDVSQSIRIDWSINTRKLLSVSATNLSSD